MSESEERTCPNCGEELSENDAKFFLRNGFYRCTECDVEGCDACIPGGRGTLCLDCEEGEG